MQTVQYMRRHRSSSNQFVFPIIPDIHAYSLNDIVRILGQPKIVRDIHNFPDDVSEYLSHLR
jgi:hypothetical protein